MICVDTSTYDETLDLLKGRKRLSPMYAELKSWLYDEFQITAYNFEFREMTWSHAPGKHRLFIQLSSKSDYDTMFDGYNYCAEKQALISEKLYELALKYQMPDIGNYRNVFVAYCNFSEEIRSDYNSKAYTLLKEHLTKKYRRDSVWDIFALFSSLTVFYLRDSDIQLNQDRGISKQIKDEYYETLHRLDEFHVFSYESFNVTFDSKENLDQHFEGNLYYYFK
ncbi:MAG: hypothetical protein ABFC56_10775 [Clostridiaceae bacterium]